MEISNARLNLLTWQQQGTIPGIVCPWVISMLHLYCTFHNFTCPSSLTWAWMFLFVSSACNVKCTVKWTYGSFMHFNTEWYAKTFRKAWTPRISIAFSQYWRYLVHLVLPILDRLDPIVHPNCGYVSRYELSFTVSAGQRMSNDWEH